MRQTELTFGINENETGEEENLGLEVSYPAMTKTLDTFKISIQPGKF